MTRRMRVRPALVIAGTLAALLLLTVLMLAFRSRLDKAHVALLYLFVVLGSSAAGRTAGLTMGAAAFLLFDAFFLSPYNTLVVNDPLDLLILAAFLITSIVAAELLNRQRLQTTLAERRRAELEQMATLGAETLNAARAEHALTGIAHVIQTTVGVERCELFAGSVGQGVRVIADTGTARGGSESLLAYVLERGCPAVALSDGVVHIINDSELPLAQMPVGAIAYALPLRVRSTIVGVLRISEPGGLVFTTERLRLLNALAFYAALAIDRQRLELTEEAAEELRRVDRLKDALLAAVSHDLRTPLTTIKGLAHEIALEGSEQALIIEREAEELASMVEGLLELSQLNAHALPMQSQLNTLDDLVGASLQRAAALLGNRAVTISDEQDGMLTGNFDLSQSVRILVNLLENAAKYSPDHAPIDVSVRRDGSQLCITVGDRGPGIPVEDRERIFEPFYRRRERPVDVRGAGLGLSIARRLAESQRGSLTVTPRAGGGSMFTLCLPAGEMPVGD